MALMNPGSPLPPVGHSPGMVAAAILLILLAGIVCYSNSFAGPFVLDDTGAIVQNESIRDLSKIGTVLTGATHATVIGRPLLNLSLAVNYALAGTEGVWDYHAFNVGCHLLAAILLFAVVHRTLLLAATPASLRREAIGLAFAVSLIWTIHPLQTESVNYVVQRAESMVAVFYLFTVYCVIRGATGTRPLPWYCGAVVACGLGMATKELMVTAPLIILFYDRVFLSRSFAEIRRLRWGLYLGLGATWVLLAVLMRSSKDRSNTAGFGLGLSSWDYAMTQFGFIVRYLRLCFWPYPLVFDYGLPVARTPMEIVPYALIVAGLLLAAVIALRYRSWIGFLGISFFVMLAPTSSIVPLVTQTAAEHRMYMPLTVLVALIVILGSQFLDSIARRTMGAQSDVANVSSIPKGIVLILIAVGLGSVTYQRNEDYRSELSLWEQTAKHYPTNARAFHAIASAHLKTGQIALAIEGFNRAAELHALDKRVFYNRANAFVMAGRYDEAIADFQRVITMAAKSPSYRALAYYQLGQVFQKMGKHEQARECFAQASEIRAGAPEARTLIEN